MVDIKSGSIGIIRLSVLFLCILCVKSGLIIPMQPDLIGVLNVDSILQLGRSQK
ncbi:hypothetical protein QUA04_10940 [Microcoleus sp. S13_C5]